MTPTCARSPLRRGLFLTLEEAAAELDVHPDDARAWLATEGILRVGAGRELVVPEQLVAAVGRAGVHSGPVRTWREAARVLRHSEDTLARRRRARNDRTPCEFADSDEVRAWWRALHERVPPANPPARSSRQRADALDPRALLRELTRR